MTTILQRITTARFTRRPANARHLRKRLRRRYHTAIGLLSTVEGNAFGQAWFVILSEISGFGVMN